MVEVAVPGPLRQVVMPGGLELPRKLRHWENPPRALGALATIPVMDLAAI